MARAARRRRGEQTTDAETAPQDALNRLRARHRRQAERWVGVHTELELALWRYATLFNEAPVPYLAFDPRGTVLEINNAATALIGALPARIVGKPFILFVHSEDTRLYQQHLLNCRRDGGGRIELRLRREGGEPRPVELVSRVVSSSRSDRPMTLTIFVDIETARERDHALAVSEKRYREIVETAREGICIVDEHNEIVFVNRRFAAMVGLPAEDLLGRSGYEFVPDEERNTLARESADVDRRVVEAEDARLRRADGTSVWTSLSSSCLRDVQGRITGMLRMYTDMSARHQLLEARQALMREMIAAQERERSRVARELHDQMGQHIVALGLGIAKLARMTKQLADAQPALAQLEEIANLLGRDVHTLAFQLRPAALDHLGLAVALTSYGEDVASHSGLEVDVHCADLADLGLTSATETGLYRIAQEAITNAVKHACARRISVVVERRGENLILIVEDDGKGLDPRIGKGASEARLGITGMRERATLLGGTLAIESSSGHGTTIYVSIPLVYHEQPASASARR